MNRNLIISLNSSGESLEKSLSLYYYTLKKNRSFYEDYNVSLFYGHNLPKNATQETKPVHGTVSFYDYYYKGIGFFPNCSESFLISKKLFFLKNLLLNNIINYRSYQRIVQDDERFLRVIQNLPIGYIYPDYILKIKQLSTHYLRLYSINNLYLEKNWIYYHQVDIPGTFGTLYALQDTGEIIHINHIVNSPFEKVYCQLKNSLVISCNTPLFIAYVAHRVKPHRPFLIGYRQHLSQSRINRGVINDFIQQNNSIIEPKNSLINDLFKSSMGVLSDNDVYAQCFLEYIKELHLKFPLQF